MLLLGYWTQLRMVTYYEPAPYSHSNQRSALVEMDFVNGPVADLLARG